MALSGRVWNAGKFLILCVALAATYVVFAAGSMRLVLRSREVQVPDLAGRTTTEATSLVGGLGLTLRVDRSSRSDAKIPAGRVVAQEPAAGSTARRQRSVKVWLSAGARTVRVPPLAGETERTATLRLTQDGFSVGTVAELRSADYPPDVVVGQEPAAGRPGTGVSLLVNRGNRGVGYVMPDLIGVNGERAATMLRGMGFRVAAEAENPYPGVAAGIVIRQIPQAGFQITPEEPIVLEVSR